MKRTKVSAHLADTPVEGGSVVVEGLLNYYDEKEKRWKPLRGKLDFYLDGKRIGETVSDELGRFKFSFPSPPIGKHRVEIRFGGRQDLEASYKFIEFKVLREEEKKKLMRIVKNVFLIVVVICVISLIVVYLVKFIRS